jgi:hypothetical protein
MNEDRALKALTGLCALNSDPRARVARRRLTSAIASGDSTELVGATAAAEGLLRKAPPVGHERVGPKPLWHHPGWQLPGYIQHVANDLIESGHPESEAIGMAVGIVKNWAAGHDGHGNNVHPDTQAAAAAAIAEWEKLKAEAAASRGKKR